MKLNRALGPLLVGSVLSIVCLQVGVRAQQQAEQQQPAAGTKNLRAETKGRPGELKRLAPPVSAQNVKSREVAAPGQQPGKTTRERDAAQTKSAASPRKMGKLQSRIMRSAESSELGQTGAAGQQQQSAPVGPSQQQMGPGLAADSWNPHNLMPTFTDQEQGDDMIALASETDQVEHQVKVLPQVNRSALRGDFMKSFRLSDGPQDLGEKFNREQEMGREFGGANKGAAEDYYTDEEEDEDELPPPPGSASMANFQKAAPSRFKQDSLQANEGQTKKIATESAQQSNKSDLISMGQRESGGGWLPTSLNGPPGANQEELKQQAQASTTAKPAPRKLPGADRLVGLFGGRETVSSSLTKTDMAIEYLKNILKSKQVRQGTNSTEGQPDESEQRLRSSHSFYPLPSQTRPAGGLNESLDKTLEATQLESKKFEHQQDQLTRQRATAEAAIARFAANDAKKQQQHFTIAPPSTLGTLDPTTAKLLAEATQEAKSSPAPYSTFAPQSTRRPSRNEPNFGQEFFLPNGTPLGGDYIESLDDFPRGFNPQQQQTASQVVAAAAQKDERQRQQQIGAKTQAELNASEPLSSLASEHSNPHYLSLFDTEVQGQQQLQVGPQFQPAQFPQDGLASASRYFKLDHSAAVPQQPRFAALPAPPPPVQVVSPPPPQPNPLPQILPDVRPELPPNFSTKSKQSFEQEQVPASKSKVADLRSPAAILANKTSAQQQVVREESSAQIPIESPQFGLGEVKSGKQPPSARQPVPLPPPPPPPPTIEQLQVQVPPHQSAPISSKLYNGEQHPEQVSPLFHQNGPRPAPHHQHHFGQAPSHHFQHVQQQQEHPLEIPHEQNYAQQTPRHHQHSQEAEQHLQAEAYGQQMRELAHQQEQQQRAVDEFRHHQGAGQAHHQPSASAHQRPSQEHRGPQGPKSKPPRIVSYNYFESPNEPSQSEHETNFQFGDSLLSSTGQVEHTLSQHELEAIQKQFMTAEHPVVPLANNHQPHEQLNNNQAANQPHNLEQDLSGLLGKLKSGSAVSPELLHELSLQQERGEYLKEGASSNEEIVISNPNPNPNLNPNPNQRQQQAEKASKDFASPFEDQADMKASHHVRSVPSQDQPAAGGRSGGDKKKSLIVYLNHPRPSDMSKAASSSEENLAQLISDQTSGDPFVSAKEFDAHGLSRDTKHLDVSSLRGLGVEAKDVPDKDGLSVVVIGDAYKYKKIVLLISSKSGGLKFIPMVKDMRRRRRR